MTPAARAALCAAAVVVVAAAACRPAGSRCVDDAQCDVTHDGTRSCDLATGTCRCDDDRGCAHGEKCNAAGRCQATGACLDNSDCGDASLFCDVTSGACLPAAVCGSEQTCCTADDQCPFKQICDVVSRACIDGCHDDGDCLIGQGCVGAAFGSLGHCGTACTSDGLCGFGELCDIAAGSCIRDARGPYCFGCTGGVSSRDCGDYGNYCLLDTVNGGDYCGVDCAEGQACPNGYDCKDVIILPRSTLPTCALPEKCTASNCERTGGPCAVDEDCPEGPPGSTCPRAHVGNCSVDTGVSCGTDADCAQGTCLKQECRQRESASFGVCSCTRDTDCPRDRCLDADQTDPQHPVFGHCELSGHRCLGDLECDVITCVNGGCLLGKNCKPADDRTCADLLR